MNAVGQINAQGKVLANGAEVISSESYPAVMPKAEAAKFIANLKSDETAKRSEQVIASSRDTMRAAIESYVTALGAASQALYLDELFGQAHEIRGLAATAGFDVAGKMALVIRKLGEARALGLPG